MAARWIEKVTGDLGDKKRYKEYRSRITQLPDAYRHTALAIERYLMNIGPTGDGRSLIAMLHDLADLLEQSAAAGTPIRDLVGADPVDFVETFMENYDGGSWIRKERTRLADAIARAEKEEQP
ncbi:DUF1048 domain-containing protein [Demequina muriae]|uniref:DUF1048 domain-containing protein n=1 Tax=Demequina muriae TaxID=3051664 RepID=A0ABT8GFV2_9MICO|nr:DUF1048 domain-containing protein [Demequina sp. EGI L300058]MDN4479821.1 DUF1048 domain-containing protein [Demequina sp. EGI L300058]